MLILKTLALEPTHGYGISVRIEQMSMGVFLPVALQRLQRAGLIKGAWNETENSRPAKYYLRNETRSKRLHAETRGSERQVSAIARILETS